jgi:hypothetical protein
MEAIKGIVNKWGCRYSLRILEEFFSETGLPAYGVLGNYGVQTDVCLSPAANTIGGPYVAWDYGHSVCP